MICGCMPTIIMRSSACSTSNSLFQASSAAEGACKVRPGSVIEYWKKGASSSTQRNGSSTMSVRWPPISSR